MSILLRRTVAALLPPLGMGVALLSLLWSPPVHQGRSVVEIVAAGADAAAPTPEILWSEPGRAALRDVLEGAASGGAGSAVEVEEWLAGLRWRVLGTPSRFELTFENADPIRAAAGATAAVAALELLFAEPPGDASPLRSRLRTAEAELRDLSAEEQADPGLIQEQRGAAARALEDLAEQYARARSARLDLEARWSALQRPETAPPEWIDSPELAALRDERARLEQRRDQLAVRFGPEWPEMVEISGQLSAIASRLAEEASRLAEQARHSAEADYRQALAHERALEQSLAGQKRERAALEERETRQLRRQQRLRELEDEKRSLLARLETPRASSVIAAQLRVISASPSPAPRRGLRAASRAALGGLCGLLLSFGVILIWNRLDPALATAAQTERALDATLLALLPEVPGGLPPGLLRLESAPPPGTEGPVEPLAAVARGFRDLRTGLLLTRGGEPARALLVTACRRGDGKTSVAAHAALALARRGARVLLIDAHLRRPRAHRLFELPPGPGLVDVLAGTVQLEEAMRATGEPGLFLMPAGDVNGGGAALLDAGSLRHLRDRLLQPGRFQHLVIDAGDVGSAAAPERLAVACSGILLVVRARRNVRGTVRRAAATLRRHGAAHLAGVWIGPELRSAFSSPAAPENASVFTTAAAPIEPGAAAGSMAAASSAGGGHPARPPDLDPEVLRRLEQLRERLGRPRGA